MKLSHTLLALGAALITLGAAAQSLTFAEVSGGGAQPLSATEVKELVSGAKAEMILPKGSRRQWTNSPDGTFTASRSNGDIRRRSGPGTWSVNDKGAYCLTFDWGSAETESRCGRLYKVANHYHGFGPDPTPETPSSRFEFSR